MREKHEIVANWLPRYTGVPLEARSLVAEFDASLRQERPVTDGTVTEFQPWA